MSPIFPGFFDYFQQPNVSNVFVFSYPCGDAFSCSPIKLRFPSGKFKIECWGAEGGSTYGPGGKGGYSAGTITLHSPVNSYLHIGPKGRHLNLSYSETFQRYNCPPVFNGGGSAQSIVSSEGFRLGGTGGGGTDIRFIGDTVNHRVIVAGGGGGTGYGTNVYAGEMPGGFGGGYTGGDGIPSSNTYYQPAAGTGGNQTSAGTSKNYPSFGAGGFGSFSSLI